MTQTQTYKQLYFDPVLAASVVRQDGWPRIIRLNGYGEYQRLKSIIAKIIEEVTFRRRCFDGSRDSPDAINDIQNDLQRRWNGSIAGVEAVMAD